jgi:hypothetical protein
MEIKQYKFKRSDLDTCKCKIEGEDVDILIDDVYHKTATRESLNLYPDICKYINTEEVDSTIRNFLQEKNISCDLNSENFYFILDDCPCCS